MVVEFPLRAMGDIVDDECRYFGPHRFLTLIYVAFCSWR